MHLIVMEITLLIMEKIMELCFFFISVGTLNCSHLSQPVNEKLTFATNDDSDPKVRRCTLKNFSWIS